mmetsp:Transcript_44212/g.130959  ORF Transcript_44212/g.130959 Transcript_44212/m.130959 type:complete len:423 (-) Transcript_44212:38-1306(-)
MDGLVVRNTFLDFPDSAEVDHDGAPIQSRRTRAMSDLTDTKLPWKVPLSGGGDGGGDPGLYTITRRRLGSEHEPISPPGVGQAELDPVAEQDEEITMPTRRNRNRARSRLDTADPFSMPSSLGGWPGGMPPPMPPGGLPLPMPSYPMPGYPGAGMPMPPWGPAPGGPGAQFPIWGGYPGYPGMPLMQPQMGSQPQVAAAQMQRGGQAGKGGKKGGATGAAGKGDAGGKGNRQQQGRVAQGQEAGKAAALKQPPAANQTPPDQLTTVMLRNIPNRYNSGTLIGLLDEHGFQGLYDFVYLPMDFQNGVNLGYAFVNLPANTDALRFKEVFHGFSDWRFDSAKVSEVSWAHPHQGLEEHVERYRNSPVMHPSMPDEYKPMIFQSGQRLPFPPPTRAIKAPKLRLSRDRPAEGGKAGDAPAGSMAA